jgi:hypothetical protein
MYSDFGFQLNLFTPHLSFKRERERGRERDRERGRERKRDKIKSGQPFVP